MFAVQSHSAIWLQNSCDLALAMENRQRFAIAILGALRFTDDSPSQTAIISNGASS